MTEKKSSVNIVSVNSFDDAKERGSEIAEIHEAEIKRKRCWKSYKNAKEKLEIAKLKHYIKDCGRISELLRDKVSLQMREGPWTGLDDSSDSEDEGGPWDEMYSLNKKNEKTWKKQLRQLKKKH